MALFLLLLEVIGPLSIVAGLVLTVFRVSVQNWIRKEVISLLKNDDTPVAVYAHQAREEARAAKEEAESLHVDVRETHADVRELRDIMLRHVTDRGLHPFPPPESHVRVHTTTTVSEN